MLSTTKSPRSSPGAKVVFTPLLMDALVDRSLLLWLYDATSATISNGTPPCSMKVSFVHAARQARDRSPAILAACSLATLGMLMVTLIS